MCCAADSVIVSESVAAAEALFDYLVILSKILQFCFLFTDSLLEVYFLSMHSLVKILIIF